MSSPRALPSLVICCLLASLSGVAAAAQPVHAPVRLEVPVQDKNFYLLSLLERTPDVRDAVKAEPVLARIAAERRAALDKAAKTCSLDLDCYAAAFQWNEVQSKEAGRALAALYRTSPAVRHLADGVLRESGMYVRYRSLAGNQLLDHAWADCIHGINRIIDVYGLARRRATRRSIPLLTTRKPMPGATSCRTLPQRSKTIARTSPFSLRHRCASHWS